MSKSREEAITEKLWNYFSKAVWISIILSILTHLLGYPPDLSSAFRWSLPSAGILILGNPLINQTKKYSAGKFLLIILTTFIVFIALWVTPSPYLLGLFFLTVMFSVFYLNKWVAVLALSLNMLSGVLLVFLYPRINTLDGPVVDSLNILCSYFMIGTLLYLLGKELRETIQERAEAREIQDILSLGNHDGIILVDTRFKIVGFKDCQTEPVFSGSEGEILQQDFFNVSAFEPLHPVLKARISVHSVDIPVTVSGRSFPCTFSCFATKDSGRSNIHTVIIFKNLTKQKQIEQQLEQAAKWALTGDIAAGLAHEVRNPLTVVKGYLELMQNGSSESKYKQYIEFMLEELQRANALLTDFLYLSKPQPLEYVDYSLEKLFSDVVNLIYPIAVLKGVTIETEIGDKLPSFQVDVRQFKQVLLNMLKNAVEATDPGGIVIFRAKTKEKSLTLEISDSGQGISQSNLTKIFDPFFTTKDEGSGLGLSISYRILRDHNCTVNVESEVGIGTKFTIIFPSFSELQTAK